VAVGETEALEVNFVCGTSGYSKTCDDIGSEHPVATGGALLRVVDVRVDPDICPSWPNVRSHDGLSQGLERVSPRLVFTPIRGALDDMGHIESAQPIKNVDINELSVA